MPIYRIIFFSGTNWLFSALKNVHSTVYLCVFACIFCPTKRNYHYKFNQMTYISIYWNFINKAISGNLENIFFFRNINLELSIVNLYLQKRLCDTRIIIKKLKTTHAQPTQKSKILFRYLNWYRTYPSGRDSSLDCSSFSIHLKSLKAMKLFDLRK